MSFIVQGTLRAFHSFFQRNITQEAFWIRSPVNEQVQRTLLPLRRFSSQPKQSIGQEFVPIPDTLPIALSRQYQQSYCLRHKRYSLLPNQTSYFSRQRVRQCGMHEFKYSRLLHTDPSRLILGKSSAYSNQIWIWLAVMGSLFAGFFLKSSQINADLSKRELDQLASNLGISSSEFKDEKTLKQACFKKLADACRNEDWEVVRKNKSFAERITDITTKTLFLAMVEEGRDAQIKQLIQLGIDYRFCDSQGNNGLHIASANGYTTLIPFLSDKFGIDSKNSQSKTPLHCAAENGHAQTVSTLYNCGASFDIPWKSPEGIYYPPIALAVLSGDNFTVDAIARKATDQIKKPISKLGNLLHLSILKRENEDCCMLEHLLTTYPDDTKLLLSQVDSQNRTPLHLAAYEGVNSAIKFLVKLREVDIHQVGINGDGKTAVHWAVLAEQPNAIRMLDWLGANLTLPDQEGKTPLLYLSEKTTKDADECRNLLEKLSKMKKREKEEPQDYTKQPPENLVFQGGGAKGLAYVGVIQSLEKIGCQSEVRRVAGTSAGSVTAALIALGYKSERLQKELSKDFTTFFDPVDAAAAIALETILDGKFEDKNSTVWSKARSLASTGIGIVMEYWRSSDSNNPLKKVKIIQNRLTEMTGLCKGDELLKWIEDLVKEGTDIENCTFKELHGLVQSNPSKYKDLYVYAIRLQEEAPPEVIRLSHEDEVWQDVVISDALRASSSIPGIFKPHVLHFKPKGHQRHARPDLGLCIDAGLIKNLPIDAFDDNTYQINRRSERGSTTNRRTLGFKFDTPQEISLDLTKNLSLAQALIYTYYHSEDMLLNEKASDNDRIVAIPVQITTLDFAADPVKRAALVESGKTALNFFLNTRQES